uniref:DNA-dependent metalloprotease SPRTN isoform X2 n=1 Tax=Jaculus jaculus TaxID=51337 RepID=UPI001E1B2603|nr:DNA-dependent metalloprotease SPRTN isoform X2 [Jaculus jaculus]
MDEDLALALRLQEEWDLQAALREAAREPLSLVDSSWELVDPTPDLRALFVQFNDRFFWGQLEAVEVKWSARMTLCAGICTYEGRGGMCSIRLSEPLLKLRPRKDLVEVYHTFHDEVDEYRRHWWRCNGPCQHKHPYYGYVKRATNRAPSPYDYWWAEHQKTCGGTYIKIKEPENYSKKGKGKTKPGKQSLLAVGNKDKPSRGEAQPLVPFSGKGHVLGDTNTSPSSGKLTATHTGSEPQGLLSQDHSAGVLRPDSQVAVKWEQNGFSGRKPRRASPVSSAGQQSVLSSYFPRISVANQKAFRSVNGSPAKIKMIDDGTMPSASCGSQRRVPPSRVPPRNVSKASASASASAAVSLERNSSEDQLPNKRSRLGDKTTFDTVSIQEQAQPGADEPQTNFCSLSSHQQLVTCPVCQRVVLQLHINSHLDHCLESDTKLRTRRV